MAILRLAAVRIDEGRGDEGRVLHPPFTRGGNSDSLVSNRLVQAVICCYLWGRVGAGRTGLLDLRPVRSGPGSREPSDS
jgi:hypothetical protein